MGRTILVANEKLKFNLFFSPLEKWPTQQKVSIFFVFLSRSHLGSDPHVEPKAPLEVQARWQVLQENWEEQKQKRRERRRAGDSRLTAEICLGLGVFDHVLLVSLGFLWFSVDYAACPVVFSVFP